MQHHNINILTHTSVQSGYQITQKRVPIAERGFLEFVVRRDLPGVASEWSGSVMRVGIKQIHIEQDRGRILYNPNDLDGNTTTVDFSRSGAWLPCTMTILVRFSSISANVHQASLII